MAPMGHVRGSDDTQEEGENNNKNIYIKTCKNKNYI
jgi:hypothetical protein